MPPTETIAVAVHEWRATRRLARAAERRLWLLVLLLASVTCNCAGIAAVAGLWLRGG